MPDVYDPNTYWESRLENRLDITTVGHAGLGYAYNYWLYQSRFRTARRALRAVNAEVRGASVTEVGVGSGAWIPFWRGARAGKIRGIDITTASVRTLSARYPDLHFCEADICAESRPPVEPSDVVTAFDMLFHITNDAAFARAMRNLSGLLKPGGLLLVSDSFCEQGWGPAFHEYHRSYGAYMEQLRSNGLQPILLAPIFFIMTTTLCDTVPGGKRFAALSARVLDRVRKNSSRRRTAWLNHPLGCLLSQVDGLYGRLSATGPSLKILVARKDRPDGR